MKIDNDIIEKIKIILLFFLQSYKILMGTMITLFIPQKCYYEIDNSQNYSLPNITKNDRLCSFNDNLENMDDMTFGLNCITGLMFILLYIIEIKREYWLIKYFDIDHNFSDNNLDAILNKNNQDETNLNLKPLKKILYSYNSIYLYFVSVTTIIFIVNNLFAISILMDRNYGTSSFNTYLGFLLLILVKLKNSIYISYISKKNNRAMSAFMTEFSSFNIIDKDVIDKFKIIEDNNNRP